MPSPLLRVLRRDARRIGCTAPFAPPLADLLGLSGEALVADPRGGAAALILGSAVLRPARSEIDPLAVDRQGLDALAAAPDWCHEIEGLPAGAVMSAGSRLDALRLVLHYGLTDAILVGASTVAAEGLAEPGRSPWRWEAATPLAFPVLADLAHRLAGAVAATRRLWQDLGLLSPRPRPALIVVTRGLGEGVPSWFEAPALADGEVRVLTSEAGARRLRARAGGTPLAGRLEAMLLPCSPPGQPEMVDLAAVPARLRRSLDVRIAGHDGGRTTLASFAAAGALTQLHLTFVGAPSLAASFPAASPCAFFRGPDALRTPPPLLALLGAGEPTWVAQFDLRGGGLP